MSEEGNKTPKFDGSEKKYAMYRVKFEAYAVAKKFYEALSVNPNMPANATVVPGTDAVGVAQALAVKQNNDAMAALALSFTSDELIVKVQECQTADWPRGLAHVLWKSIEDEYHFGDNTALVNRSQELSRLSLKDKAHPKKMFSDLASITVKYSNCNPKLQDSEKIAAIIMHAPKEYRQTILNEQRIKGAALTLQNLKDAMGEYWRLEHEEHFNSTEEKSGKNSEIVLTAFNGRCNKCGKIGHKAAECRSRKQSNGGGGNNSKKCDGCGKTGHTKADCWQDDKNKSKRPPWFKKQGASSAEHGAAAVDNDVEYLLCGLVEEEVDKMELEFPSTQELLTNPNVWIGDTGATVHNTAHSECVVSKRKTTEADAISWGNGSSDDTATIGNMTGMICDKNGNQLHRAVMKDVRVTPTGKFNLFSLSKMMKEGWKMTGDTSAIVISKGNQKITFDIRIPTPRGVLYCMYMAREMPQPEVAGAGLDGGEKTVRMNIDQAHLKLGHKSEDITREIAKGLGWEITRGGMKPCASCAAGKAKQKNLPKVDEPKKATVVNGRIYSDIATVKAPKSKKGEKQIVVAKKNWHMMVDECTGLKFSKFYNKKNDMPEPTCEQFHKWKQAGKPVLILRQDNAGENKLLEARAKSAAWKLDFKIEYTARDTPQQNSLVEVGFATTANQGRAIMHWANLPSEQRYKLWHYAFELSNDLDGLALTTVKGMKKSRYEHWLGRNPKFAKHLRTFGEAGTVKTKLLSTPKVMDKGTQCMFIGYAKQHSGDTFRMYNPVTSGVHTTRDVIWLHRKYYQDPVKFAELDVDDAFFHVKFDEDGDNEVGKGVEIDSSENSDDDNDDDDDDADGGTSTVKDDSDSDSDNESAASDTAEEQVSAIKTRTGRSIKAPQRLVEEMSGIAAEYKCELTAAEENYYSIMNDLKVEAGKGHEMACVGADVEMVNVGAGLGGGFENTNELHVMKYDEAMATKDRIGWTKAVAKEHGRMKTAVVFKAVKRRKIPRNAKVLTSTWAMKKKANGDLRARINARGYEQIDGIHYREANKSAPVVNDTTFRVIMVLMVMAKLYAIVNDVKGAFLHGDFAPDEEMYMEVPRGFESYYPNDVVLLLLKTIYGCKQSALAFWKKLLEAMRKMGMTRSAADPCLYFQWHKTDGLLIWISWVDDCLCVGKKHAVEKSRQAMSKCFECDELGELKEYVGCKVDYKPGDSSVKLTQPVLLQSYRDEFDLKSSSAPKTPAVAGHIMKRGTAESNVGAAKHGTFRKGVGKLIHMMKWSRPDILNAVRELSRFMSGATQEHMDAMHRVMEYCTATPERGLELKPDCEWDGDPNFEFTVSGISDSDYGGDDETRKSISGNTTMLNGAPVKTSSRQQNSVTLSVTEAELVSGVECAQDMMFVKRVLESMGLKVKTPMVLSMDNKGAIDLTNNWSVGGRTRHMGVRLNFIRELKEAGLIEVRWIPTKENCADMHTKNLAGPAFEKHTQVYCGVDEYASIDAEIESSNDSQGKGVKG